MLVAHPAHRSWLPLRMIAVLSVWAPAAVAIGFMFDSPLAVAVLTITVLAVSHVYARFEAVAVAAARHRPGGGPRGTRTVTDMAEETRADHFISTEFAAARRGRELTLVMFGFDDFDGFSQREGPAAAAEALREFGQILKRMTRQMNLSARYGWRADAFLSVLSDADAQAAEVFVQRVRGEVASSVITLPPLSSGVVEYRDDMPSADAFVMEAEHALDAARSGSARFGGAQMRHARQRAKPAGPAGSSAQARQRLQAL